MIADTNFKYTSKANDSFKTKLNLYLFDKVISHSKIPDDLSDFYSYMITQNIVDVYTTVYWQQKAESMIGEISIEQIYRELTGWKIANKLVIEEHRRHYVSEKFPKLFPKSDFDMLLQGNSCSYCNITTEKIEILADKGQIKKKSLRGWVLEIDRLDSNFEYSKANCVMACYWCNNAKTDEFTQKEFEEIGKSIEIIWKNRLASL